MRLWRWDEAQAVWQVEPLPAGLSVDLQSEARVLAVGPDRCVLFAKPRVLVNGVPALPVRVLADRDMVYAAGQRACFVSEDAPRAAAFTPQPDPTVCGRCQGPMRSGETAVQCPRCGAWHHAGELACWSYAPTCSGCDHPTAGPSWEPEPVSLPLRGSVTL